MKRARKTTRPEDVPALCGQLVELQVHRKHYIRAVIRETNSVTALARRALGWHWDLPEKERDAINGRANKIVRAALDTKPIAARDKEIAVALTAPLQVASQMCAPAEKQRAAIEREMKKIARSLPAWQWAEDVRGLSDLGLAVIIAEAGDISRYTNPGKLWKRLGLAPVTKDGATRACSTWRMAGGLSADNWSDQGSNGPKYKPQRRAAIFSQVGSQIIGGMGKGKRPLVGEDISLRADWSPYERLFVERLRHEAAKTPAHIRPATKEGKESYSKHAAFLAQRYVEKRLLRNLWRAWQWAGTSESPTSELPAANSSAQAERSAIENMSPCDGVPSAPIPAKAGKRRASIAVSPKEGVPAAISSADEAERSASRLMSPSQHLPSAPIPAKAGKRRARSDMTPDVSAPAAISSADEAERSAKVRLSPMIAMPSAPPPAGSAT